jgi:hypothetical protein
LNFGDPLLLFHQIHCTILLLSRMGQQQVRSVGKEPAFHGENFPGDIPPSCPTIVMQDN